MGDPPKVQWAAFFPGEAALGAAFRHSGGVQHGVKVWVGSCVGPYQTQSQYALADFDGDGRVDAVARYVQPTGSVFGTYEGYVTSAKYRNGLGRLNVMEEDAEVANQWAVVDPWRDGVTGLDADGRQYWQAFFEMVMRDVRAVIAEKEIAFRKGHRFEDGIRAQCSATFVGDMIDLWKGSRGENAFKGSSCSVARRSAESTTDRAQDAAIAQIESTLGTGYTHAPAPVERVRITPYPAFWFWGHDARKSRNLLCRTYEIDLRRHEATEFIHGANLPQVLEPFQPAQK